MKTLISILAMISILLGLVSAVTPIPGASILIAGGLTVLICTSPSAQYCLMWIRSKVNWVNKFVFLLENKVGTRVKVVGRALGKTHPPQSGTLLSHREFVMAETEHE